MAVNTTTRSREHTRARLLDAAHEVFGEVGLGAASVEEICERAGFTRGAFYSNFGSKDELFLALIGQLAEDTLDQVAGRVQDLEGAIDPRIDPGSLVRRVVGASVSDGLEPLLAAEMRVQALRDPRLREPYRAWQVRLHGRIEDIMRTVVDRFGLTLRVDPPEAAQLLADLSEQTSARAALEGWSREEASERLNTRLTQVVGMLVS